MQPRNVASFFGMIANIDENIGRLETFLQERGLRENTLLVFLTDNGGTAGVPVFITPACGARRSTCTRAAIGCPALFAGPREICGRRATLPS